MKQCKKCPWKVSTNPNEIPGGYCVDKHKALKSTIQVGFEGMNGLHIMACHESPENNEKPCAGYLHNQLGKGNNIALRLWAMRNLKEPLELDGGQHRTFADTLPKDHRQSKNRQIKEQDHEQY